jgi:hypothetical protein
MYENEIVTRSAPRWAWHTIDQVVPSGNAKDAMIMASEHPDWDELPEENLRLIIELYPMGDGTHADFRKDVTSWDVLVRPDGGDPVEEWEDMSYEVALDCCQRMLAKYPGATLDTQLEDLLS